MCAFRGHTKNRQDLVLKYTRPLRIIERAWLGDAPTELKAPPEKFKNVGSAASAVLGSLGTNTAA